MALIGTVSARQGYVMVAAVTTLTVVLVMHATRQKTISVVHLQNQVHVSEVVCLEQKKESLRCEAFQPCHAIDRRCPFLNCCCVPKISGLGWVCVDCLRVCALIHSTSIVGALAA